LDAVRIAERRKYKMALYLISYDISEKDAFEYGKLWKTLEDLGSIKILYSEWVLVRPVGEATEIYNHIAPCTQKKDRLIVQEILKDARWDQLLISNEAFADLLESARG
jgi:hypothetical protein